VLVTAERGLGIHVTGATLVRPDGAVALRSIDLDIRPGQMVAVAGRSGAGKSTLLEVLAGQRALTAGQIRYDGDDVIGFVPQDDIVHRDLPVRAVLRYAARLRLPSSYADAIVDARVRETMAVLGLEPYADHRVGALSGGQRKRVSIGTELLARPAALFLDEPTSGLDPATAGALVSTLRDLAARGTTVVMTTHSPEDLRDCDALLFVAPGGVLAYRGAVEDAASHFGVARLNDIYDATAASPAADAPPPPAPAPDAPVSAPRRIASPVRRWSQFTTLARRNVEVLVRNRLSTAIMLGSPALVVGMFVVLFQPGAAARDGAASTTATMTAFWMAFAAFFFGLTFGLLQVVTESAIVRRESFVGVRSGSYIAAKVAVLAPVLLLVVTVMVAVLWACDRVPHLTAAEVPSLVATLHLAAVTALALGLLASALVRDPSQATLALPMLCFPAVLFSGGVLPVDSMPLVGRAISVGTANRWAYEAVSADLGTVAGRGGAAEPRLVLVGFALVLLVATGRALRSTARQGAGMR
jgi:ABC-type multidrug transport system ATPase subunit/ABC-type multidrug transport system permease subunit